MGKYIGVSDNNEIIKLAVVQARQALHSQKADFSVGYSEGIVLIEKEPFTAVWCAVINRAGKIGLGGGLNIKLSKGLQKKFAAGLLIQLDLEQLIEQICENPYEILVKQAIYSLELP